MIDLHASMTSIMDDIEAKLPNRLAAFGVLNFEDYLVDTPSDVKKRQLCIFLDTGAHSVSENIEHFNIQMKLPKVTDCSYHLSALLECLFKDVKASKAKYVSIHEVDYDVYYPGELPQAGNGCFVHMGVSFENVKDDCD